MVYKFACPACGQRVSATEDWLGTEAICPACELVFVVPAAVEEPTDEPTDVPAPSESDGSVEPADEPEGAPTVIPSLADLIASVEALGIIYHSRADADEEEELHAIDEFLCANDQLTEMLHTMAETGEITRAPRAAELHAVRSRLFARMMAADPTDPEVDLRELFFSIVPGIRARG